MSVRRLIMCNLVEIAHSISPCLNGSLTFNFPLQPETPIESGGHPMTHPSFIISTALNSVTGAKIELIFKIFI